MSRNRMYRPKAEPACPKICFSLVAGQRFGEPPRLPSRENIVTSCSSSDNNMFTTPKQTRDKALLGPHVCIANPDTASRGRATQPNRLHTSLTSPFLLLFSQAAQLQAALTLCTVKWQWPAFTSASIRRRSFAYRLEHYRNTFSPTNA